jgi:hypothetical protein
MMRQDPITIIILKRLDPITTITMRRAAITTQNIITTTTKTMKQEPIITTNGSVIWRVQLKIQVKSKFDSKPETCLILRN